MRVDTAILDVDGLFCDVHGALAEHFGWDMTKWPKGEYDMERAWGLSTHELWNPYTSSAGFWAGLPKTKWADELMDIVQSRFDNIGFCTKALMPDEVRDRDALAGKAMWLDRNYPGMPFMITTSKSFCANPRAVLIDDYESNIGVFVLRDGHGILFPRVWNRDHELEGDMDYMEWRLDALRVAG
jgi:hypothetical protein